MPMSCLASKYAASLPRGALLCLAAARRFLRRGLARFRRRRLRRPIVFLRMMVPVDQVLQMTLKFQLVHNRGPLFAFLICMIRKLKSGEYRLYSRKADAKTGKRRNLGTFSTREAAEKHERAVQFFKRAH